MEDREDSEDPEEDTDRPLANPWDTARRRQGDATWDTDAEGASAALRSLRVQWR